MDPFEIHWRTSATKELRRLDRQVIPRILTVVEALAANPFPSGARKLQGTEHAFRLRLGDYRIVYEVVENIRTVVIARVRHRKDAYR